MLDAASRARDFDFSGDMTYLNTAAEGLPPRVVGEALQEYYRDKLRGMAGREPHFAKWEEAKSKAASFLGLSPEEVNLCSCTSEAFNLLAQALKIRDRDEVLINDLDFPAGITPWLQSPAHVQCWKHRDGRLELDDLPPLLSSRTRLVTVSLVSFFNGFTIDLRRLVEVVRKHSPALIAVDVTQAIGRIPLDVTACDFIVSSTHKWLLSSHGGGIVGIPRRSAELIKVAAGGWLSIVDAFGIHRFTAAESKPGAAGFSLGMPNFPAVYALHAALDYLQRVGVAAIDRACRPLVERCFEGLSRLPVEMLTPRDPTSWAGILAFRHPEADRIHQDLLRHGIHVMHQAGRMRVSIHGYNTSEDVEHLIEQLTRSLARCSSALGGS